MAIDRGDGLDFSRQIAQQLRGVEAERRPNTICQVPRIGFDVIGAAADIIEELIREVEPLRSSAPDGPAVLNVRLPVELYRAIREAAHDRGQGANAFCIDALRRAVPGRLGRTS